jgi:UV DNA damage endonuclease
MRIGYPCINRTIDCTASSTFRLKSYTESRVKQTVKNNLECLQRILEFNLEYKLFFFRISSDLVPFASHPINRFNWQEYFQEDFKEIGEFINKNGMRISMHPDQFTLINSLKDEIFERSKKELKYHVQIFDLMKLDASAKVQIHVGGVYGDKTKSIERFVTRFGMLDDSIIQRLVIENDDKLYDLNDCLKINAQIQIPILLDVFHHKLNNSESLTTAESIQLAAKTWNRKRDGVLMVDYSSQEPSGLPRQHSDTIDIEDFGLLLKETESLDFDIMLEIKDKEKSAIKAINLATKVGRTHNLLKNDLNPKVV